MTKTTKRHIALSALIGIIIIALAIYNFLYTTKENFYTGVSGFISIVTTGIILLLLIAIIINLMIANFRKEIKIIKTFEYIIFTALTMIALGYINNIIWANRVQ
jgi:hypothetical protein